MPGSIACTISTDDATLAGPLLGPSAAAHEAGSRESRPLPPGLLTEAPSTKPTKLFIGGISRHTTTKQLRDHFSQFGRVLDCVAMRQPDGRPRGFGYVTLDSPSAAERCLREPQMIDNRIVDMKAAVPEGSSPTGGASPMEAGFGMGMFGQADFHMGMYGSQGFWPEAGAYGNNMSWWPSKTSPTNQGLDCLDLLSAPRDASHPPTPSGLFLQSIGTRDFGDFPSEGSPVNSERSQTGPLLSDSGKMSASAPEFVPKGAQEVSSAAAAAPAATKDSKPKDRLPLGEVTNTLTAQVDDLLKSFKSPTHKLSDFGHGQLLGNQTSALPKTTGFLMDDDEVYESSPGSSSSEKLAPASDYSTTPETTPEANTVNQDAAARQEDAETPDKDSDDEDVCKKLEENDGPFLASSEESDSGADGSDSEEAPVEPVDMESLPSLGSKDHFSGECKRCNFYPKGRCQNGKDCTFCHFSHDKRKPSRQEKRERRAAWLDQQDDDTTMLFPGAVPRTGALLTGLPLQPGCLPFYLAEDDMYSDETLAYPIFPGLPPIHATKLPAPLPLPGMDTYSQSGPALPPGLTPPAAQTWPNEQPALQQVVSSAPMTATFTTPSIFATAPTSFTPASTAVSTPMPTPMATPTASMSKTASEARAMFPAVPAMATFGTQTVDYKCQRCVESDTIAEQADESSEKEGCVWSREELLRLRDNLAKIPGATDSTNILEGRPFRTQAITASSSI